MPPASQAQLITIPKMTYLGKREIPATNYPAIKPAPQFGSFPVRKAERQTFDCFLFYVNTYHRLYEVAGLMNNLYN